MTPTPAPIPRQVFRRLSLDESTTVGDVLRRERWDPGKNEAPAVRLERRLQPLSALVCVPVFALLAAGVAVSGSALDNVVRSPVAIGIAAGLVVGKAVGVVGGAWLTVRLTKAELNPQLAWSDVVGVGILAGSGSRCRCCWPSCPSRPTLSWWRRPRQPCPLPRSWLRA